MVVFSSSQASNHYGELYINIAALIRLFRTLQVVYCTACKLPVQKCIGKIAEIESEQSEKPR